MPDLTFSAAIESALAHAMARDDRIVVFGEDARMTRRGLYLRFGPSRVRNTPISESAILGTAVGSAMAGLRPVAEIMFVDFLPVAMDLLVNHAAKVAAFSDGDWDAPLVVRAACGGGYGDGGQHEQALWGMLAGVPGLTVVVPSTPADAAGLMLSALDHPGPVVYLEHKLLSHDWLEPLAGLGRATVHVDVPAAGASGEVADPPVAVPIGEAVLRRPGRDVLVVGVGVGVHHGLAAAQHLEDEGVQAAVLDLRTVAPLDRTRILDLVAATGRIVVVDEDYTAGGLSGEIAAVIAEAGLHPAYARVTCEQTIPYARDLERQVLPNPQRVRDAVRGLMKQSQPATPRSA